MLRSSGLVESSVERHRNGPLQMKIPPTVMLSLRIFFLWFSLFTCWQCLLFGQERGRKTCEFYAGFAPTQQVRGQANLILRKIHSGHPECIKICSSFEHSPQSFDAANLFRASIRRAHCKGRQPFLDD